VSQRVERTPSDGPPGRVPVELGARIRACRQSIGISLRALAAQIGISAGALSQIETGKVQPSVPTLYAIVERLDITLDMLTTDTAIGNPRSPVAPRSASRTRESHSHFGTMRGGQMAEAIEYIPVGAQGIILLRGDERMRRVSGPTLPGLECMVITYPPCSSSPHDGGTVTHEGHEFNYVIAGRLVVDIADQSFELAPGDSLSFPSTQPHRFRNPGEEPSEAFTIFTASPEAAGPHS
jgi:transcriptional regulator with XRE-family HTH domain